jgi:hypothetical protein
MQESKVRGLKESDGEGIVECHEKILNIIGQDDWHGWANWIRDLAQYSVAVKHEHRDDGQR